jgi:hypothetical protein
MKNQNANLEDREYLKAIDVEYFSRQLLKLKYKWRTISFERGNRGTVEISLFNGFSSELVILEKEQIECIKEFLKDK